MEPHSDLNNFDYIVLGIVLVSGLLALMRGFVREVLSLSALLGACFAAAKLYPLLENDVRHYVHNQTATVAVSALAVFIFSWAILSLLAAYAADFVKGSKLTSVDRSLGFLFGLARGALIVSIIYMGASTIVWPDIDKPETPEQQAAAAGDKADANKGDKDSKVAHMPAPEWLMKARTRPALAYGAKQLRALIPQGELDKTTKGLFDQQKKTAEHLLDQQRLDMLSTPAATAAREGSQPSYDNKSRENLDQLINQKGAQ